MTCEEGHRWGRENRQGQCDCGLCKLPDPRGLDCGDCSARLNPADEGFDELYEAAPWWYDLDDDEEVDRSEPVAPVNLSLPVITVRRGSIQFPAQP